MTAYYLIPVSSKHNYSPTIALINAYIRLTINYSYYITFRFYDMVAVKPCFICVGQRDAPGLPWHSLLLRRCISLFALKEDLKFSPFTSYNNQHKFFNTLHWCRRNALCLYRFLFERRFICCHWGVLPGSSECFNHTPCYLKESQREERHMCVCSTIIYTIYILCTIYIVYARQSRSL